MLLSEIVLVWRKGIEAVGKWESGSLDFHFSTAVVVGVEGMWESHSDFQGLWEERETCVWFSSLSIARINPVLTKI